jgi:hypothetical protein
VKTKIRAAADYLVVAPTVVRVARDLDLPVVDSKIGIPDAGRDEIEQLRDRWGLGESVSRVVTALDVAAAAG